MLSFNFVSAGFGCGSRVDIELKVMVVILFGNRCYRIQLGRFELSNHNLVEANCRP